MSDRLGNGCWGQVPEQVDRVRKWRQHCGRTWLKKKKKKMKKKRASWSEGGMERGKIFKYEKY